MRYQGRIVTWKDEKGFGFIEPDDGGEKIFLHVTAFIHKQRRPLLNEVVTYEFKTDGKGRKQAELVKLLNEERPVQARPRRGSGSAPSMFEPAFAGIFICFLLVMKWRGELSWLVLLAYLLLSVWTFFAYARDKSAAQAGSWRISEGTLHLYGMLGGWLGAVLAQRLLRHKSQKQSFINGLRFTIIFNCFLLYIFVLNPDYFIELVSKLPASTRRY